MEGLKNMMEDNVEHTLNQLLPTMPNVCSCDDCKLDMATYALNRLQPKYARTAKGIVMHRFDTASSQVEAEILTAVVSAITIIGSHPHHPPLNTANAEQASSDNDSAPSEQVPADSNTAE
ncbi:MAG: late competence development ComFB family protein [Lachnospiraceae bacterium]|nr:late competence development ComFB family protein [Lachnospiraceae bacterium]